MSNQLRNGAILSYVQTVLNILVVIFYTPFITNILGQHEYGLYALMMAYGGYLSLLDCGLSNVIIRYISKNRAIGSKEKEASLNAFFFMCYSILSAVTLLFGYMLYKYISYAFVHTLSCEDLERAQIMTLILIINGFLSLPLSMGASLMQAYEYFTYYRIVMIGKIVIVPIVSIPLLCMGYQSVMLIIVSTVFNVISFIICYIYVYYKGHAFICFKTIEKKEKKEIIIYAMFLFLEMLMGCVYWKTGQIILGIYSSMKEVAVYSIAVQFVTLMMALSTGISSVLLPRITMMVANEIDFKKLTDLMIRVGRIQTFILGAFIVCYVSLGKVFIKLWIGNDYIEAFYIGFLFIVALFVPLVQNTGVSILLALNLNKYRMAIYTLFALLSIVISIPLSKNFGGIGCAISTAVSLMLSTVLFINLYYLHLGIDVVRFFYQLARPMINILLSTCFCWYISSYCYNPKSYISLLVMGLVFLIIYVIIGQSSLNEDEKMHLKKLYRRGRCV